MKHFVYERKFNDKDGWETITREQALDTLLGTWKDNDMTRDMLTIPNRIQCMYSVISVRVEDDKEPWNSRVLMAGLWNMLPMWVEYDEDGNRITKGEQE